MNALNLAPAGLAELTPILATNSSPPVVGPPVLHRIGAVRRQQGVALRTVARLMGVDVAEAARQEVETCDLPLSVLHQWQRILDVPLSELLVESEPELSAPVLERARLIKVMKTAATILERAENPRIGRLAEMLVEQLVEIMPELAEVGPWHDMPGGRRTRDDLGRIAERPIPSHLSRRIEGDEAA
jgi:transcriptional regulator with XRE-family HTH domain